MVVTILVSIIIINFTGLICIAGGHTGLIQSSGGGVLSGGGCQALGSGAGGRIAVYHTTVLQVSVCLHILHCEPKISL